MHSERSEIINQKINNFRDNKLTTTKNHSAYFSLINPDVHVNKRKKIIKGVLGGISHPPEAKIFF